MKCAVALANGVYGLDFYADSQNSNLQYIFIFESNRFRWLKAAKGLNQRNYYFFNRYRYHRIVELSSDGGIAARQQILAVFKFFNSLAGFIGHEMSLCTCLMNEWSIFHDFLPSAIIEIYMSVSNKLLSFKTISRN